MADTSKSTFLDLVKAVRAEYTTYQEFFMLIEKHIPSLYKEISSYINVLAKTRPCRFRTVSTKT